MKSRAWILTALGQDQPGIVAAVTKILFECGANLEDSSMARLAGEFAMMVSFTAPAAMTEAKLRRACAPLARRGIGVHLTSLGAAGRRAVSFGRPHLISVYGADQPGIVYRVSSLLARLKINITDVSTQRTRPSRRGAKPLYLMVLDVELPARVNLRSVQEQLRSLGRELAVEISLRPADTSVL